MSKTIKKNFFAPLASGPGAMRRAAMMLLVMMLTTMTAWAQDPFIEYQEGGGMGDLTIRTPGHYNASGEIRGNLIIETEGEEDEVILDVYYLNVQNNIQLMNGKLTLNVHSYSDIRAEGITVTTLNMDGGTISCTLIDFQSGTVSGGTINATGDFYAAGSITGGTLTAEGEFFAGGSHNNTYDYLTISGGNISAETINILTETTINVTDPNFSIAADKYKNTWSRALTISGRSLIDEVGNVYAAGEVNLSAIAGKTLKPAYSVAFDENGGSTVTDLMVAGGMKATEPATTREGYTFVRWNNGEDAYDFNTVVTSDLTLTAHWKKQLSNSDITVSAIADQTYTGSAIEPTVTVKDGETDITDQCDFAITDNTAVGTANVAITAKSESAVYSGSTSTTFTILPKAVTITADNDSKTYDGTPLTKNTFTTSALESGDTHTFTVVMSSGSTITNVGTQPNVIATVDGVDVNTGEETAVGNYLVTTANGTLTVNRKAVTITADNDTKTYDGTPLTKNTFTTSALESGDTHTFTVVMSSGSTITNVGTQPNVIATVDGVDVNTGEETAVGNYLVTTANGTLTVTARETDYGCLTYTETGDAATSTIELNGNSTTDLSLTASVTGQTTLNRSFTEGTKVTLCLPFAMTAAQKNALGTFYQFDGLKEGTTNVVKMQALDNSADLEANKAYILDPKTDIAAPIDFGQQTIAASPTVVASTSGTSNEFTFQGTYSLITWDENHTDLGRVYCFVGLATDGYQLGEFAKVGRNTTCKPFRAYLKYTGEGDLADAKAAVRGANGEGGLPDTIAIEWISATGTKTGVSTVRVERIDGDWYSLDGRKLNGEPTKKGIYIYKGKKVIKK